MPIPTVLPAMFVATATFVLLNAAAEWSQSHFMRIVRPDVVPSVAQLVVYEDADRPDVIFMGSSRVLFGVDPDMVERDIAAVTGAHIKALNLGLIAGATDVNYLTLKNVIRDDKKPDLIVYGLSEFEFLDLSTPIGIYEPDSAKRAAYLPTILRLDDFPTYSGNTWEEKLDFLAKRLFPLYRDRDLIRHGAGISLHLEQSPYILDTPEPERGSLRANGFRTLSPDSHLPEGDLQRLRAEFAVGLSDVRMSSSGLERMAQFLTLAKSRGIDVMLVNMPVSPEFLGVWGSTERRAEYRQTMQSLADHFNVPLLDLYEAAGASIPLDGFFDDHHLNSKGAAAVTTMVLRTLLEPRFQPR